MSSQSEPGPDPNHPLTMRDPAERGRPATYTGDKKAKLVARDNRRWVRLSTAVVYVLSVSLAAVILALYYSLVWRPAPGPGPDPGPGPAQSGAGTGEPRAKSPGTEADYISGKNASKSETRTGSVGVSPGDPPVPGTRTSDLHVPGSATDPTGPARAGQGSISPAGTTAEDPSNLPTHRVRDGGGKVPLPRKRGGTSARLSK
ncbi:putative transmembrane protein INAFM2 [Scophthalmus maximus]|uniref:putative transmembrane protein INAFM2 n=1 Tax=Scophthalmus maximus TaxID=52904 RepID=UPI001FA892DF|nr:putative transmembrane protein INAFM2 [Scophthalmus maximus]